MSDEPSHGSEPHVSYYEPELKHSGLGIASFALAIMVGLLGFGIIAVAGVLEVTTPGGIGEEAPTTIALGLALIGIILIGLLGIVLGIAALFQRNRAKLFAALGIVLGVGAVGSLLGIMVIGAMMN